MKEQVIKTKGSASRCSFIKRGMAIAGTASMGAGLMAQGVSLFGQVGGPGAPKPPAPPQPPTMPPPPGPPGPGGILTRGDGAILKLLAAAETIEADLWQQYAELGGVSTGTQNAYQLALQNLDSDGSQYISSNTLDEISHATFLAAYLESKGESAVDLDGFRTLPSSQATGAKDIGRLTNLTQLTIDTSWYTRYRSQTNPDFGATFAQALPALFTHPIRQFP